MLAHIDNFIQSAIRRYKLDAIEAIALCLVTLAPFVALSFFNHPSIDDYSFTINAKTLGFWKAVQYSYTVWNGRYFSAVVLSVNPLVFNWQFGYKLVPIALLGLLLLSLCTFIHELTFRSLSVKSRIMAAAAVLFVYLYLIPSLSEGLYWMSGAVTYQLANILTLFLFSAMMRANRRGPSWKRVAYLSIIFLLIASIVGLNETSMFLLTCLLAAVGTINSVVRKKIDPLFCAALVVAACASYFVFSAPGATHRISSYTGAHNFSYAIRSSFRAAFGLMGNWLGSSPILLFTALFVWPCARFLRANKEACSKNLLSINPVAAACISAALTAVPLFPAYWSLGFSPPDRVENVSCFVFVIGWSITLLATLNYFVQKQMFSFAKLPRYAYVLIAACIVFNLKINPRQYNNVGLACFDLFKGTAYHYDREMNERYRGIQACASDTCEVSALKYVPASIYYSDMTTDENDWKNKIYAQYFSKKALRIKK